MSIIYLLPPLLINIVNLNSIYQIKWNIYSGLPSTWCCLCTPLLYWQPLTICNNSKHLLTLMASTTSNWFKDSRRLLSLGTSIRQCLIHYLQHFSRMICSMRTQKWPSSQWRSWVMITQPIVKELRKGIKVMALTRTNTSSTRVIKSSTSRSSKGHSCQMM